MDFFKKLQTDIDEGLKKTDKGYSYTGPLADVIAYNDLDYALAGYKQNENGEWIKDYRCCQFCQSREIGLKILMVCGYCKVSLYCSKKCQKEHWIQSHKKNCSRRFK